jgi:hypothetical protein
MPLSLDNIGIQRFPKNILTFFLKKPLLLLRFFYFCPAETNQFKKN